MFSIKTFSTGVGKDQLGSAQVFVVTERGEKQRNRDRTYERKTKYEAERDKEREIKYPFYSCIESEVCCTAAAWGFSGRER